MTTTLAPPLEFTLPADHEADAPAEARGLRRDEVRLLVSPGDATPVATVFADLDSWLRAGDVLVVNTSATVPAAIDGRLDGEPVVVHYSGRFPGDLALAEVRAPVAGVTVPLRLGAPGEIAVAGGGRMRLHHPFGDSRRLWIASWAGDVPVLDHLARFGRPIRYRHVGHDWPIACYQTVFGTEPGSAEMPSASRPFTERLVTRLVRRGVVIAPLLLHTGVSSLEGDERPYPEQYRIPPATAMLVNAARAAGGRVVAAGTTVVRALATTSDDHGVVHPGSGWTDVFVDEARPVRSVDGLLTGWHEPESTHLHMLTALTSRSVLQRAYDAALEQGALWHEFGDTHLILPAEPRR
ncbi:MAG: S-adenosylmethionine:tRNA ribosyltransferase-isomerase [Acidimicrobiia bacterium]